MRARTFHRILGLVMLLPITGWAITGAIFFLKPGYGGAYESLAVKTYPMASPITVPANPEWLEARVARTILGDHVLVRTSAGWQQIDAVTSQPRPAPVEADIRALVGDAITASPARYGAIASIAGSTALTTTGARVTVSWNRLSLSQRGRDTDRIDGFYKVHYLQWTGIAAIDRVLGGVGLVLLVVLSGLGVRLWLR